MFKLHLKIYGIIITLLLVPLISFAQGQAVSCSKVGYTIETINGIFTKEGGPDGADGATGNKDALKREMDNRTTYNGEPLTFDYLYNPTHGPFGAIDLSDVAIQKTFEGIDMGDPDFLKMLNDASTQVKTQKLLLVAHSQGNFYANNFYNTVTTNGDISPKSIGVYGVGSPAKEVAGSGGYLTSGTDTVINKVRKVLPGTVLKANDWIEYKETDDSGGGHGFREIYLNYRGEEIKKGIEESLAKLSVNQNRSEDVPCVTSPQKRTAIGEISHVVDYGAQFAVASGVTVVTASSRSAVDNFIKKAPSVIFATWRTYDNTVTFAIWVRTTTIAVGNAITDTVMAVGSFAKNAFTGLLSGGPVIVESNSASVILATIPAQDLPVVNANNIVPTTPATALVNNQTAPNVQQQPQTVFVFEPKVQAGTDMPKLVFVGSFPIGAGSAQVMGTQTTAPVSEELAVLETEEEIVDNAGSAMAEPALSTPQCSQTLAVDGCLLATTTVRFEWTNVAGADHYLINKNGEYATTTEKSFNVEIKDFSDYIFEVVAIGADGVASATSSQKVSVATIPIAINEIAWMGTRADWRDEWFEIKNNTGHTIDLSQWKLNAKDGAPYVDLAGNIAPHAYIVFERKINTVLIPEPVVYATSTGLLSNTGDQLSLFYTATSTSVPKMFDQTPDGAWPAGATSTRQTMERYSSREPGTDPENWGTNLGYIKNGTDANGNAVEGTPGEQNSVSTLINKGQDITSDFTLTDDEERYVVPNGIFVNASSTLTIEHGVTISFLNDNNENYGYFVVNGQIVANGTHEDPVVFNSFLENRAGGFWIDNNNGTSTFEYAHFEDINSPITVYGGNLEIKNSQFVNTDGGVESDGTNTTVLIENTNFASSTSDTIGAYNGSAVRISSSTISNTLDGDAIGVYYSTMTIASSTISNTIDGDAIGAYYSKVIIASSTISNTLDGDAIGVYYSTMSIASTTIDGAPDRDGIFSYKSVLDIENSTIRNTGEDAIILSNSTSTISNTIVEAGAINEWGSGIYISRGTATITDTSVSGFSDGSGVYVDKGILSISSSTIKNVADYGIYAYKATTTISNVTVENGGINGVEINQGTATIADTSISGFTEGAGISVSLNRKGNWQEMEAVPGIVANISNSEITGNAIGVEMEVGSAIIGSGVSVQENTKNIVVCSLVGECVEQ